MIVRQIRTADLRDSLVKNVPKKIPNAASAAPDDPGIGIIEDTVFTKATEQNIVTMLSRPKGTSAL